MIPQGANQLQGRRIRRHPTLLHQGMKADVLAVAEAADGFQVRRIVRRSFRETDAAGDEERPHAVVARSTVHVVAIVGFGERAEGLTGPSAASHQIPVEHLGPGGRVDCGGEDQHAVQIEHGGLPADREGDRVSLTAGHLCGRVGSWHGRTCGRSK
jgi:hypothetical protein